jgi:hypothetical protein
LNRESGPTRKYLAAAKKLQDEDADGDALRKIERALMDRIRKLLGNERDRRGG